MAQPGGFAPATPESTMMRRTTGARCRREPVVFRGLLPRSRGRPPSRRRARRLRALHRPLGCRPCRRSPRARKNAASNAYPIEAAHAEAHNESGGLDLLRREGFGRPWRAGSTSSTATGREDGAADRVPGRHLRARGADRSAVRQTPVVHQSRRARAADAACEPESRPRDSSARRDRRLPGGEPEKRVGRRPSCTPFSIHSSPGRSDIRGRWNEDLRTLAATGESGGDGLTVAALRWEVPSVVATGMPLTADCLPDQGIRRGDGRLSRSATS